MINNLAEANMSELVKCGRQLKYRIRIISARTYLLKAGFVEYIEDKNLIITETGKNIRKAGTKLTKNDSEGACLVAAPFFVHSSNGQF
jgi:restriction endonuclease Mrr